MHHTANPFRAVCFIMFFLGQFIHAWMRASEVIHDKTNGVDGYKQYFDLRAPQVMGRFFSCYLLYGAWQLGYLATIIGAVVPGTDALMKAHPHPIPVNEITAGAFGFLADWFLKHATSLAAKRFPGIEKDLPPAEDPLPDVKVNP